MFVFKVIMAVSAYIGMLAKSMLFLYGDSQENKRLIGRVRDDEIREAATYLLREAYSTMLNKPLDYVIESDGKIYVFKNTGKENAKD